ncbi:MAG: peptidoglycan editing factor PgeF [Clostridiales bacterium]|jgi:YfiH family protein|nr:peptidoglycan editing factor PgeF [Clostridiales bacterium]
MNFKEFRVEDRLYLKCSMFNEKKLRHCYTTRFGGVSKGSIVGLNLGFNTNDSKENILKNYKIMSRDIGFNFDNIIMTNQNHSTNALIVTKKDAGKGLSKEGKFEGIDALLTNEKNLPIGMIMADCVPIILYDKAKSIIGICHAGWRGTSRMIVSITIKKMKEVFRSNSNDVLACIGPAICEKCFKTNEETANKFFSEVVEYVGNNEYSVDLPRCNILQILLEGIPNQNIFQIKECTKCFSDKYFSFRREGENAGRMGAFIELI